MGTIAEKLRYLAETKSLIKAAIKSKGVAVSNEATFKDYAQYIKDIEGETEVTFQSKTVTPGARDIMVTPDEDYNGLDSVLVYGDANLKPENIKKDEIIFGVLGTHEGGGGGLGMPEEYQQYLTEADAFYLRDYEHFFIAENEDFVTVGFLNADFTVLDYDAATGDFASVGWYSYKYTKATDTWEGTDYTSTASPGYNYAKNIKYADCYIEYNGMTLFPVGINNYPDVVHIGYSNFEGGSFTETLETNDTLEYGVEFDADGRPNKIAAPDGTVTAIDWGDS